MKHYTYHDIGIFHHTNNFIDLKDTPSTYGTDGQLVKINPTEMVLYILLPHM